MATFETSITAEPRVPIPLVRKRGRSRTRSVMQLTDRKKDDRSNKEFEPQFQHQVEAEAEKATGRSRKQLRNRSTCQEPTMEEHPDLMLEAEQSAQAIHQFPHASSLESQCMVSALINKLALDPCASVEKLERMIAMYEGLKAKEAELAYNAAKGRVLKKLSGIKIVKNRSVLQELDGVKPQTGPYAAFKYAPLEEIDKHLRPLLAEEDMDLSYSDEPGLGDSILIRGRLKHLPGGYYEDSLMPAPPDTTGGKSGVQAVGSTNSYLRRYVACNIFNIVVVGDDDDGNGGTIDEAQTETILALIKKAKVGPKFLKYMKAQSVEDAGSLKAAVATIAALDYRKAISTLEEQIAKAEAGRADLSS